MTISPVELAPPMWTVVDDWLAECLPGPPPNE
jgi:hypothetical protein